MCVCVCVRVCVSCATRPVLIIEYNTIQHTLQYMDKLITLIKLQK